MTHEICDQTLLSKLHTLFLEKHKSLKAQIPNREHISPEPLVLSDPGWALNHRVWVPPGSCPPFGCGTLE